MAVYPLTMIPRFRKRNRERERAVTRQIEFHGKFSASRHFLPLLFPRNAIRIIIRTNFEAMLNTHSILIKLENFVFFSYLHKIYIRFFRY